MPARNMAPQDDESTETAPTAPPEGYISLAQLNEILEERDRKHAEAMAIAKAAMPRAMVAAHAGGPGYDNHQVSWSLAEQEASKRGDVLDHWT